MAGRWWGCETSAISADGVRHGLIARAVTKLDGASLSAGTGVFGRCTHRLGVSQRFSAVFLHLIQCIFTMISWIKRSPDWSATFFVQRVKMRGFIAIAGGLPIVMFGVLAAFVGGIYVGITSNSFLAGLATLIIIAVAACYIGTKVMNAAFRVGRRDMRPWLASRQNCKYKMAYSGDGIAMDLDRRQLHLTSIFSGKTVERFMDSMIFGSGGMKFQAPVPPWCSASRV